ncbi:hypothetical protein FGA82_31710 [Pseudomonas fluorescens]|nr:hypothetical protein FGA82_31710 [Pseudomonas fluorescens]
MWVCNLLGDLIVPKRSKGMPQGTLRVPVREGTRSVPGCMPTRSVGTINVGGYFAENFSTTLWL